MPQFLGLLQPVSHRPHAVDEIVDWSAYVVVIEVAEDLLPILDGRHAVQWRVEELVEMLLGVPDCRRADDLIQE